MRFKAGLGSGQPCAGCVRYLVILIALTACSPTAPLHPTTTAEIGATATVPANTYASPLATPDATSASTLAASSLQPVATETLELSPTTRLAVVDQSSVVDTSRAGWWSIKTLGPVGQTFRPSFAGLDAVELWTEDQWDAECSGVGARLKVNLHEAAIDGPLVGSSSPIVLPDCFKGIAFFGFPSLIAVTPDKVYVMEVVVTSGDNWGAVWQQVPDAYPRGESMVLGASGNGDIWFQEGLRDFAPRTEAYCQNNLWQHVRRADGGAFKDQGDCLQYVNTGR
jgi:hypothetical protein